MSKDRQRGNREKKKPKQDKPKVVASKVAPIQAALAKPVGGKGGSKRV